MLSSEIHFNTQPLTGNQELSSRPFSRKARFQIPARHLRQQLIFQEKDAFKPLCRDYCTVRPTGLLASRECIPKRPQKTHLCILPHCNSTWEHKHGSSLENKLLRKEKDENCTKATVVTTSVIVTAMKDTHRLTRLSTKRTRNKGSPSSWSRSAQTECGRNFPTDEFQKLGSWRPTHELNEDSPLATEGWGVSEMPPSPIASTFQCFL